MAYKRNMRETKNLPLYPAGAGNSSSLILEPRRRVPVAVAPIRKTHTELQPKAACNGPTARRPIEAVMDPHPLISPVTVPRDLLFPRTDGWDERSAATAEVMILLGLLDTY